MLTPLKTVIVRLPTISSRISPSVTSLISNCRMSTVLPPSPIPLLTTAAAFREWRERAMLERKSVGYVPTMGALHEGHLSLVRKSLEENDLIVLSIFVNPTQFAPHEDLATYPRTLEQDIAALNTMNFTPSSSPINVVQVQYDLKLRPSIFQLISELNLQPTRAYFGQKDIQQALLLKRLTRDLLMSHPLSENVHIVPTARDKTDGLALSSRNSYLSQDGRKVAATLYQALSAAKTSWEAGSTKADCLAIAHEVIETRIRQAKDDGLDADMHLDFIEFNDADSFEVVGNETTKRDLDVVLLSGALFIGKTRLIDNLILGDIERIVR
ncbi:Pantothenate synthetase [Leucoagaricus sp. SymC.cos]|nr:Pantothenate synthetase [Leucoagaricus sp. SymC.cos]